MLTKTVFDIPICYNTANHNIKFCLSFGEGKEEEVCPDETERRNFSKNYDVEVFESGEGDDYMKGYRVIANEAPFVVKISDISITNENSKYDYAIGFALDNEAPEYKSNSSTIPNNIPRDGTMWNIPAKYQWMTKFSLEEGYKPTEEELELGMEETSQNTGLIYLTFMVFQKLKPVYSSTTRGATRGSSGARFGYGNEASSSSVKSEFEYAEGTEKIVMPIRLRINNETARSNTNCSQHLKGASINALRRQMMTVPF